MTAMDVPRYVGRSVTRVEDERILTGRGRYIADLKPAGVLHAAFLRSSMAHARILNIDVSAALALPGVVDVLTGQEIARATSPLQVHFPIPGYARPLYRPLATDRVRHVGDPVAIVVAQDRYVAEDGRDAVLVDYEPLPAVISVHQALDEDGPVLFDDLDSNVVFSDTRTYGDPDSAIERAHRIVRHSFSGSRVAHMPIECRGGLAEYDPGTGDLTYHATNQAPHALKLDLARILGHPAERLRVLAPDIGGAFGQKAFIAREDVAICFAARKLERPVKWVEDRIENLASATQARGDTIDAGAAVDADGRVLALDVNLTLDQGAYPCPMPTVFIAGLIRTVLPVAYRIENFRWRETHIATNKATYGFYRGPWSTETRVREALMDRIAAELGLDVVDVRRRNLLSLPEQPRPVVTGTEAEGVSALECFDRAVELVDYDQFRQRQRRGRDDGRLIGIGFASYVEPAPGPPSCYAAAGLVVQGERAVAMLEPDGHLTVVTMQTPHGQGHETTLAQVAATEFGLPMEQVRIRHSDTDVTPFSLVGTAGSRAGTMATGAVINVTRSIRQKVLNMAANMLEASAQDLRIVDGAVTVTGSPEVRLPLGDLAMATHFAPPEGEEYGLRTNARFTEPPGGWSGGTHACLVEVDSKTGMVTITRYLVVEDCGKLINPAVVDGQIRGGVAQGVGMALLEAAHYDEEGNFVTGTLVDYLVPTAMEVPAIEIQHYHGEPLHEYDFRGIGEGGLIAAPAAVANAVADALGVPVKELPITPSVLLDLIDEARRSEQTGSGLTLKR